MMLERITTILMMIVFVADCTVLGYYFTHMLQLNSYFNKRYLIWCKENVGTIGAKLLWVFITFLLLPTYAGRSHEWKTQAIVTAILLVNAFAAAPEKAKLAIVITARVKRLFITQGILAVGICAFLWFDVLGKFSIGLPFFWVSVYPLVVLLANIINMPIEKLIKGYYINDAKKTLASRPNLKIIGVTGSYGKTSTKNFLRALLTSKYNVLMTPESYNTPMGIVRTIRENSSPVDEIFIAEMGAKNRGDIKEICDLIDPQYGVLTAIGEQHLETFKNLDNIIDTKFELIESLPKTGHAFLNYDNQYIRDRKVDVNFTTYSTKEPSDFKASNIKVNSSGSSFSVTTPKEEIYKFETKLLGEHNIQNIAGCIAVACHLGVSMEEIGLAIKRLKPVKHRLELLPNGFIDDAYNSNPAGFRAALDVLSAFEGQKVLVTPGMVELGERQYDLNKEMGEYAADKCDYAVLVGEKQAPPLKEGLIKGGFNEENIIVVKSLQKGLAALNHIPAEGDRTVLLENDLPDNFIQ